VAIVPWRRRGKIEADCGELVAGVMANQSVSLLSFGCPEGQLFGNARGAIEESPFLDSISSSKRTRKRKP
jgi:hypothetical protein